MKLVIFFGMIVFTWILTQSLISAFAIPDSPPNLSEWSLYIQAFDELIYKTKACDEYLVYLGRSDKEKFTGFQEIIRKNCVEQQLKTRFSK